MVPLDPRDSDDLLEFVDRQERTSARPALSDQSRLALQHPGPDGPLVVTRRDSNGRIEGFAELSPASVGWTLDVVVGEQFIGEERIEQLVTEAVGQLAGSIDTDTEVTWWRDGSPSADARLEQRLGFEMRRELLQMRRELPTGMPVTIDTRSFVPGIDDGAFLEVNNRAFAGHHEQSNWDLDALRVREDEPWFEPEGFRLHERDGRLAGFCWTKIHADGVGEIYVIAVDPDFTGLGLGKQLTLAGLESLGERGVEHAMLYVDADNHTAVSLYERLGFTTTHSSQALVRVVRASVLGTDARPSGRIDTPTSKGAS
jgi:mycothiol synthase